MDTSSTLKILSFWMKQSLRKSFVKKIRAHLQKWDGRNGKYFKMSEKK